MRYDYLTRFYSRYGKGGFKRLMNDGFNAKNNHYDYVPTYTAPGHASIYTGTSPMNNGIIGNNWYDKVTRRTIYNADDENVDPVGTQSEEGKMSPRNMISSTVTDELEIYTQGRAKVIGISLKDRGAILPAGHAADAAYWFTGGDEGAFISSTFYLEELPGWVSEFNASAKVTSYMKDWNTLYPIDSYTASGADLNNYESAPRGMDNAVFPYDLKKLAAENGGYSLLKSTPYGNNIVADFAIEALKNEFMGKDDITDFLAISFSSTDYIGHKYSVNSVEVEDTYLRLDQDIERLLKELDKEVGAGNYTVFLTADHGAVHNPAFLTDQGINAGYFDGRAFEKELGKVLDSAYNSTKLIEDVSNGQIFFDHRETARLNINEIELQNFIAVRLVNFPQIYKWFTRNAMLNNTFSDGVGKLVQNGFHAKRSGDVIYTLEPAVISYGGKGSTHGSAQNYDTHVPLLFYGYGINKGSTFKRTQIIDIAPTISSLLGISFPNAATGNPIVEVLKE
jgi:predicted AlkP superfamily pyrophosphatase or phosphodiesterase